MNNVTIDLGTTNTEVSCYNSLLNQLSRQSSAVSYEYCNDWVEFDAEEYFTGIIVASNN